MSQFDRYTSAEYVEALRSFLAIPKKDFMRVYGFTDQLPADRKGRIPKYQDEPIWNLEALVNAKAERAEATDTSLGERYVIARDYAGLNDSQVAAHLGVSREMVRRWSEDKNRCSRTADLAELFFVPLAWLEQGGEEHLDANSHVGVRVGWDPEKKPGKQQVFRPEALAARLREQLLGLQQSLFAELPDLTEAETQTAIERSVFETPELSKMARRAGGRWQVIANTWLFAPWVPIEEHGLQRRYWSDEVEVIIQEELAAQPSVFGAWAEIDRRCRELGLTPKPEGDKNIKGDYPTRITLHKRVEKERARAARFGVDLNAVIMAAVEQCATEQ